MEVSWCATGLGRVYFTKKGMDIFRNFVRYDKAGV